MRTFRNVLLFLFGLSLILFGVFAHQLGFDPDPGIGGRRMIILMAGISVILSAAYSERIESLAQRFYLNYTALRGNIYDRLRIPDRLRYGFTPIARKRIAYGTAILACAAAIALQAWFGSAGTWNTWKTYSYYYDQLANAFLKGQTWLETPVNALLLKLPNPYDPAARGNLRFLWDASLYEGKYYLYWGPLPAVVIMVIKLIHPMAIGDNLVVFAGVALTTVFQTLLLALLWERYFQRLPVWTLFMGVLTAGLVVPFNWMNNRPEIYEAAIISAQAFLMGGIYFAALAVRPDAVSTRLLAAASVMWACAVASRTIVVFEVIFASVMVFIFILGLPGPWMGKSRPVIALGLPLMLCALGLGIYNFARFGSPLDFGVDYQLALFDQKKHKQDFFSVRYILPNIENYVLTPPERVSAFPYLRAKAGDEIELHGETPDFYYKEQATGIVYTFPFAAFALVPVFRIIAKAIRRRSDKPDKAGDVLQWTCALLSGMTLIAVLYVLAFFFTAMRYYADVTPLLAALALMGFWLGYQAVSPDWFLRFAYSGAGILLAGVTIIVSNLLALLVSQRINTLSPDVLPTLDALFKAVLSR